MGYRARVLRPLITGVSDTDENTEKKHGAAIVGAVIDRPLSQGVVKHI